ncbi:MAG: coproporphyrinogen dehydrogenase HemZ [Clostridiales Family XIII bacterium]|nr:coproporphyrinogen dehydrogenase HemZ [Clostridiales Family XIII bacterium]
MTLINDYIADDDKIVIEIPAGLRTSEFLELGRMFLRDDEFEIVEILDNIDVEESPFFEEFKMPEESKASGESDSINVVTFAPDKDLLKRDIYKRLSAITGKTLPWGTLTGVKPLKMYEKYMKQLGSVGSAQDKLKESYLVSDEKIARLNRIETNQLEVLHYRDETSILDHNLVSLYIGIPFCPSRCSYCSFFSEDIETVKPESVQAYLDALYKEIDFVSKKLWDNHMLLESIYIGGGTPTALNPKQVSDLLDKAWTSFPKLEDCEFTLEAGRPDTITAQMSQAIADSHVTRISINPQSMKDETLELIGRNHTSRDICEAIELAKSHGIDNINADVIAGLPGETLEDFKETINSLIDLEVCGITVHTLSIKKGSNLIADNSEYHHDRCGSVAPMVDYAYERLIEAGFEPYYIYRQKNMIDNLENIGYAKPGHGNVYNIRIMEEKQTIIALGAGASTKVYYPDMNRIDHIFNVKIARDYVQRIDELIERKNREDIYAYESTEGDKGHTAR